MTEEVEPRGRLPLGHLSLEEKWCQEARRVPEQGPTRKVQIKKKDVVFVVGVSYLKNLCRGKHRLGV